MVRMYKCPHCGRPMYKKDTERGIGQFYHCEYCGYIQNAVDTRNLNTAVFANNTLNRCPRCGGAIIQKHGGPRGIFYGCENFPRCDFAYSSLNQNVPHNKVCSTSSRSSSSTGGDSFWDSPWMICIGPILVSIAIYLIIDASMFLFNIYGLIGAFILFILLIIWGQMAG